MIDQPNKKYYSLLFSLPAQTLSFLQQERNSSTNTWVQHWAIISAIYLDFTLSSHLAWVSWMLLTWTRGYNSEHLQFYILSSDPDVDSNICFPSAGCNLSQSLSELKIRQLLMSAEFFCVFVRQPSSAQHQQCQPGKINWLTNSGRVSGCNIPGYELECNWIITGRILHHSTTATN